MQRPIKFRAWWQHPQYNEDGGMYGVAGIVWGTPEDGEPEYKLSLEPVQVALVDYPLVENYQKLGWNKQCKLMQYTGLKDKNGVEIYEGDIVKAGWNADWYGTDIAEVKFGSAEAFDGCCGHDLMHGWYIQARGKLRHQIEYDGGLKAEHLRPDNQYEVIGNIYENPELLGGTDDTPRV